MELEFAFVYRCVTEGPVEVHDGAVTRQVWAVTQASLEGEHVSATLAAPGSDWMVAGDDGFWRPDVRVTFRTDGGGSIALTYTGLVEQTDAFVAAAEADRETQWEDQYMRMALRFSANEDRYAWLTRSLFVAQGRILGTGRVEYAIYRVT